MREVKTYTDINTSNTGESFAISKMEEIYQKHEGKVDTPHRHDYYTVLVVKAAKGIHNIDFTEYPLENKQLYFLAPGQVHQLVEKQMSFGFVMTFTEEFLVENSIELSFIEGLHLFQDYGQSPPLEPKNEDFLKIEALVKEIYQLFHGTTKMRFVAIGAYIKLILIACNNICSYNPMLSSMDISEDNFIRKFKRLVNIHFKIQHSTSYYATAMHITPDHLNRVIRNGIGKTAKEYIQTRIIVEAKRLLYFSSMTTKEIGFQLGFNEPANFSAFFKKCTGYSPTIFKQKQKNK